MEIKTLFEPADDFDRQIARIIEAELGWEDDRRVFGFLIRFDLAGGGQQAAGWIGLPPGDNAKFLDALLKSAGCSRWSQLRGKVVITRHDPDGAHYIRGFEPLFPDMHNRGITFSEWWPDEPEPAEEAAA